MSVRSVSTSSTESERLRCTRDKHNMNFCYTLLYYGLSLYLRSSALCHLGSNTSRRDAALGCDANYVHLPAATGQYGYSGHVINLPQDVASFSNTLPQLPSELDVIIVRKEGTDQSHRHFHVRRSVAHRALQ